ncbi:hypothetical protein Ddye_011112 [Dipteronia dyeriana]|uniref:Uncharacterized protein n=1 Tax=Dipteronia dyeriana TaxID=168575 RepID=A0AAE0CNT6_9ROSI|nr:hypothetical protein Ddye_011112 [Dipteronia dyeriana]
MASSSNNDNIEEIAAVLRRFGDEQSTLLDQFERLSFEVQLNQAILRRSFSEPTKRSSQPTPAAALMPFVKSYAAAQMDLKKKKKKKKKIKPQGSSSSAGFTKVLKKLLKHIFVRKGSNSNSNNININNDIGVRNHHEVPDPKNPKFFKAFSRSMRL